MRVGVGLVLYLVGEARNGRFVIDVNHDQVEPFRGRECDRALQGAGLGRRALHGDEHSVHTVGRLCVRWNDEHRRVDAVRQCEGKVAGCSANRKAARADRDSHDVVCTCRRGEFVERVAAHDAERHGGLFGSGPNRAVAVFAHMYGFHRGPEKRGERACGGEHGP